MKSKLLLFLGSCTCSGGAVGCISTETGNPSKETSSDPPIASTEVTVDVGLRGTDPDLDVAGVGAHVTGLWLQITEIELVGCSGVVLTTSTMDGISSITMAHSITVKAPEGEEVCAVVVRTQPLSGNNDATLPAEGVGQGAVVQGTHRDGSVFLAALPERVTSVLVPVSPGLSLGDATDLTLLVEGTQLIDITSAPSTDDSEFVGMLQDRLPHSFSLVRGAPPDQELLATSSLPWEQVDDSLCISACGVEERAACGTPCDPSNCRTQLMDPACEAAFRGVLQCRVGLSPAELECDPTSGRSSAEGTHCGPLLQQFDTCQGAPL